MSRIRLGLNIDHIATVRNARGGTHPDPVHAAKIAEQAGADGITAHLREDRRHIRDEDIFRLKGQCSLPLNMEMAATSEMLSIALKVRPHATCIVPEKRKELTTEGGLDVAGNKKTLQPMIKKLQNKNIRVSLFIEPSETQVKAAAKLGADIVELHTGVYCHSIGKQKKAALERIRKASKLAQKLGLECHAGHGLSYSDVAPIAAIPQIVELNIGHFLVGEAIFLGLETAVKKMKKIMDGAR